MFLFILLAANYLFGICNKLIIQTFLVIPYHFYMYIPNNLKKSVALTFCTMIFFGVKNVIKLRNPSSLVISRLHNSSVFSILQQSTTIILLKVTLTYSAVKNTFNYLLHKRRQQHYFDIKVMQKKRFKVFRFQGKTFL